MPTKKAEEEISFIEESEASEIYEPDEMPLEDATGAENTVLEEVVSTEEDFVGLDIDPDNPHYGAKFPPPPGFTWSQMPEYDRNDDGKTVKWNYVNDPVRFYPDGRRKPRYGRFGVPRTAEEEIVGVVKRSNAIYDPDDPRMQKAASMYDKEYMQKASRFLAPIIMARVRALLNDNKTPPNIIVTIAKDILPYAYDRPGTQDGKDDGPKRIMIVTNSSELPDVD